MAPGIPTVQASSQAWASIASAWSTSLNEGWIGDFRLGSTGGFTVNCSPSSSGYIFSSSGDGTTGSGNNLYSLGRAVRILQGSTTFYGRVATASVAGGVTTVGLSSGTVAPSAGLSTGVAFTSVAVGIDPGTLTLSASTAPSATAKFHREDGTWAAPSAGAVKEMGYAVVDTSETTTSTSFTDLATSGPSVTMTASLNDKMNCHITVSAYNDTAASYIYAAPKLDSDATAAGDGGLARQPAGSGSYELTLAAVKQFSGLSAASHTVKVQYQVSANTGAFARRHLIVYRGT